MTKQRAADEQAMRLALAQAHNAALVGEVPVGAVLVAGYRGLSSARRIQILLMALAVAVIVVLNAISLLAIWSRYSY